MPLMDGASATQAIREMNGPNFTAPIIATTALTMSGDREELLAKGLDDYISKPFNKAELRTVISRWLG